jgi:gliding motility-associated-like protein
MPPGIGLVADDVTVHVDDLASFTLNPYANDSLPSIVGNLTVQYEFLDFFLPPCFTVDWSETGQVIYGMPVDTVECCGTFSTEYMVWSYGPGWECLMTHVITITVVCDDPQNCSLIDLSEAAENENTDCVATCGGATTMVIAPFNDQWNYNWTIDGGSVVNILANPSNVEVQWDSPGQGNILVEMEGPGGTNVLQQCIDIGEAPLAAFDAPATACLGSSVQFTSTGSTGADHFWQFGDGQTSGAVNPVHEYATPGTYTAVLTVTDPLYGADGEVICACSDSVIHTIEILPTSGPTIECISTLCEEDSACYWTTDGCAGANYTWTAEDASGNPVAFTGQGTPEICLQWGDGPHGAVSLLITGCGTACPEPTEVQIPIISSSGTVSGPTVVCSDSPALYALPQWMDVVYDWTVTGAASYTAEGHQVAVVWGPAGPGSVSATYQSPFLGTLADHDFPDCSGFTNLDIDIRPALTLTTAPPLGCTNGNSTFTANSAAVNWSISPNADGTPAGGDYAVDFSAPGTYLVTAAATDPTQFCNAQVSSTIAVTEVPAMAILGPVTDCAGVDLLYAVDTIPPGIDFEWSALGATPSTSTGTNILLNWNAAAASHEVTVTAALQEAPFCAASTTLDFSPWPPATPLGLDHSEACANTVDTFVVSLSTPLDAEYIGWVVSPATAGSIVGGQGTDTVVVQWNDYDGIATMSVTSEVCELTAAGDFDVTVHGTPGVEIAQAGDLCNGAYVPAMLSTTSPFVEYLWTLPAVVIDNDSTVNTTDTVSTEASIGGLEPFTYGVTVTDVFGCQDTDQFQVIPSPSPAASINSSAPLPQCIPVTGDIFICAPANSNWIYDWSNGETSSSFYYTLTGAASTLSLTTTNAITGCNSSASFVMQTDCSGGGGGGGGDNCIAANGLQVSAADNCNTVSATTSCTDCTDITWFFEDGTPSSSDGNHTYFEAGCYNVTAYGNVPSTTPGETCLISESDLVCIETAAYFDVERLACTEVAFLEATTYLEVPGMDNEIVAWSWDFGDGNGSLDPNPIHTYADTGQYTITLTATALNGCAVGYSTTLDLTFDATTQISLGMPFCVGQPAVHTATATGAVSYAWDIPDGIALQDDTIAHTFEAVPIGTAITVTAFDLYQCPKSSTEVIVVNPEPSDPLEGVADAVLCADPGEILLTTDPIFVSHQWMDGGVDLAGETGPSLLAQAGKFSVLATEGGGCTVESKQVRIQVRPDPMPTIVGPGTVCTAGEAEFTVTGNYTAHEWYVNGTLSGSQASLNLFGIPGNVYDIEAVVTDVDNCVHTSNLHTATWVIGPDFQLTASSSPACAESNVVLSIDPSAADVAYFWNTGATGSSATAMQSGVYTATGVDANGCTHNSTIEVFPLPDLGTVPHGCYENCLPDTLCSPIGWASQQWYLNDAAIPGGLLPCLEVNQSGIYHVIASNQFGCFNQSEPLELTLEACACDITGSVSADAGCCAELAFDNASTIPLFQLEVTTTGDSASFQPAPGYAILASGPDFITLEYIGGDLPQGDLSTVLQLCFDSPGAHSMEWNWTGSGASVCSGTLVWNEPTITHTVVDEQCPETCDGSITTAITDGTGWDITFLDIAGGAIDPNSLCPGTYIHTMTDGSDCIFSDTLVVQGTAAFSAAFSATDAACFGGTGEICVTETTGGTGPVTVSILPPPVTSGDSCHTVLPGAQQVFLQDSIGCLSSPWELIIGEPIAIEGFFAVTPISCFGAGDGALFIDAIGGTGSVGLASPYVLNNLPDTLFNLDPGTMTLIFEDDNGCTDTLDAFVPEPNVVDLSLLSVDSVACHGACTGQAEVSLTGGTGNLTLYEGSISDSTAISPAVLSALCAGDYALYLSDANGCSDSLSFSVETAPALEFYIATDDITCTGMLDGSAQVALSGGTGSVGWVILGEAVDLDSLAEGTYYLEGFDTIGCTVDSSFAIDADIDTDMVLSLFSTPVSCWQTADGTATAAISGGTPPITYAWDDPQGQASPTAIGLSEDTYTVVVTDQIGCTLTGEINVDPNEDCLFISDGITPNGDGINDKWIIGGLEFFPQSIVTVYNRWGQAVFEASPGTTRWDGTFNGATLPAGDYYYVIRVQPGVEPVTGTVTLKY